MGPQSMPTPPECERDVRGLWKRVPWGQRGELCRRRWAGASSFPEEPRMPRLVPAGRDGGLERNGRRDQLTRNWARCRDNPSQL